MPGFASVFPESMRRSAIFWDEALLKPFKKVAVLHGHAGQMKWFNVEGHLVKS